MQHHTKISLPFRIRSVKLVHTHTPRTQVPFLTLNALSLRVLNRRGRTIKTDFLLSPKKSSQCTVTVLGMNWHNPGRICKGALRVSSLWVDSQPPQPHSCLPGYLPRFRWDPTHSHPCTPRQGGNGDPLLSLVSTNPSFCGGTSVGCCTPMCSQGSPSGPKLLWPLLACSQLGMRESEAWACKL